MMRTHHDEAAAPPDDGGHAGSFTRPEQQIHVGEDGERRGPSLHRDTTRRRVRPISLLSTSIIAVFLVGLLFLWQYCGAATP
jgi:hypothetical protein